jgi:hypothetical protein
MRSAIVMIAAATAIGAAVGGCVGQATVDGVRADAVVNERLAGAYGVPMKPANALDGVVVPASASDDDSQTDCTDCSDFQIGHDWAIARGIRAAAACAVDSWSFQRGCEAAVREQAGV